MFEAYSVAVRVSLVNNVTSGLMGISAAFARVHGNARALQATLNQIRFTMLAGAGLAATGFFGLAAISKTLGPAKEYAHQLALMNTAGMRQVEIANSINAAWRVSRDVPTSTATENLAAIRDLRATLGTTQEAINFLPQGQKLAFILSTMQGTRAGRDPTAEVTAAARALDIRNATTDPIRLQREMQLMTKAIMGSGGQLTARDFNATLRLSRATGKAWSEEFTYMVLPSLMQELKTGRGSGSAGGPAAGLVSAAQSIVAGRMTQRSLREFQRIGMLDMSRVEFNKVGDVKAVMPGGVVGSETFQRNPYEWAQRFLVPAWTRAGIVTQRQQRQSLSGLFGSRTAEGVMATLVFERRQIERDRRMFGIAKGMEGYESLRRADPRFADAALAAQWKNLLTVIGYEILPYVVAGTLKLVDGLKSLTAAMRAHPLLTKVLVGAFVALAAAMAIGGTILLLRGAFMGLGLVLRLLAVGRVWTMIGTGVRMVVPWLVRLGPIFAQLLPWVTRGAMIFLRFLGPIGLAITAITLLVAFWPQISRFLGRTQNALGSFFVWMHNKAASLLNWLPGVNIQRMDAAPANAPRASRTYWDWKTQTLYFPGAKMSADVASRANRANDNTASPYVAPRGGGQTVQVSTTVNMDGKKVGAIVSTHQARAVGAGHVAAGRHDPAATPAAAAAGSHR